MDNSNSHIETQLRSILNEYSLPVSELDWTAIQSKIEEANTAEKATENSIQENFEEFELPVTEEDWNAIQEKISVENQFESAVRNQFNDFEIAVDEKDWNKILPHVYASPVFENQVKEKLANAELDLQKNTLGLSRQNFSANKSKKRKYLFLLLFLGGIGLGVGYLLTNKGKEIPKISNAELDHHSEIKIENTKKTSTQGSMKKSENSILISDKYQNKLKKSINLISGTTKQNKANSNLYNSTPLVPEQNSTESNTAEYNPANPFNTIAKPTRFTVRELQFANQFSWTWSTLSANKTKNLPALKGVVPVIPKYQFYIKTSVSAVQSRFKRIQTDRNELNHVRPTLISKPGYQFEIETGLQRKFGNIKLSTGVNYQFQSQNTEIEERIKVPATFLPYNTIDGKTIYIVRTWKDSFVKSKLLAGKTSTISIPVQMDCHFKITPKFYALGGVQLLGSLRLANSGEMPNPYALRTADEWKYLYNTTAPNTNAVIRSKEFMQKWGAQVGLVAGIGTQFYNMKLELATQFQTNLNPIWKNYILHQKNTNWGLSTKLIFPLLP